MIISIQRKNRKRVLIKKDYPPPHTPYGMGLGRKENEDMSDLIGMIQDKFADCLTEKEVCLLYAEIRMEIEKQMEYMFEKIKESEE